MFRRIENDGEIKPDVWLNPAHICVFPGGRANRGLTHVHSLAEVSGRCFFFNPEIANPRA
jgi:hypothetical protein